MRNLLKPIAILVVVLTVLVMGFSSVIKAQDPESYTNPCTRYDKAIRSLESELNLTFGKKGRDNLASRISEVELQKANDANCESPSEEPRETTDPETEGPNEPEPTETASEGLSEEPSQGPNSAPTTEATSSEEPTQSTGVVDEGLPHFFYFDANKRKARDFGPGVTGTDQEVFDEFARRMHLDPALLCANGYAILGENPGDSLLDCSRILMNDTSVRDSYEKRVFNAINSMSVADKAPGIVTSAYMVEVDGIPSTILIENVHRPEAYRVLRLTLTDGRTVELRLECGFQWDFTPEPEPDPDPTPTPTPTKPAPGPSTTPETTPTPDTTPSETPSDEPSEEPSDDPSEEPSEDPSEDPSEEPTPEPSKDPSKDPQAQDNIPEQVRDDDNIPTAEGCINGGIRDRDGVCNEPSDPAVEQPDPTETYTAPAAPSAEPVETERSVEPQPTNAPSPSGPEQGRDDQDAEDVRQEAEENSDPTDNPFGETNP